MHSSGLYIHGSWKWQLIQLSINLGDTAQELNENHMQEKWEERAERSEQEPEGHRHRRGGGGKEADLQLEQINQAAEK